MARPLRLEFPGALYHVTSRGNKWGQIRLKSRVVLRVGYFALEF